MITIANVLSATELTGLEAQFSTLAWKAGTSTAGGDARKVKKNLQADLGNSDGAAIAEKLAEAIQTHPVLQAAATPHRYSKLLLSRTDTGGGYGWHVDNPLMGADGQKMRTDLSFTLFLSDPDRYQGGELMIEAPGGEQSLKPAAGDLVLYPSSSLHQVAPVTGGTRYVCVGWIESLVRDAAKREVLFDLQNLKAELGRSSSATSPELLILSKSISNLMRLWAET